MAFQGGYYPGGFYPAPTPVQNPPVVGGEGSAFTPTSRVRGVSHVTTPSSSSHPGQLGVIQPLVANPLLAQPQHLTLAHTLGFIPAFGYAAGGCLNQQNYPWQHISHCHQQTGQHNRELYINHIMGPLKSTLCPPSGATEWHKLPSSNRWSDFRSVLNQCIFQFF